MTNTNLWIDDPGIPTKDDQKPWLPPRIGSDWLCKRGKGTELNEVAGYQLAVSMQIPVPQHHFFIITSRDPNESLIDEDNKNQRVGLLVKEVSGPKTNYSELLRSDPESGILHLGLRLFSTSEHPELIQAKEGVTAIDLEFVLPHLNYLSLDSTQEMRTTIKAYRDQTIHEFKRCHDQTEQLGLHHCFLKKLPISLEEAFCKFLPDYTPLSNGRKIAAFYRDSFKARLSSLLELERIYI